METIGAEFVCPFCGSPQQVDATRLAELKRYRQEVFNQKVAVEAAKRSAAAWEPLASGRATPRKTMLFMLGMIYGVPLVIGIIAMIVSRGLPVQQQMTVQKVLHALTWIVIVGGTIGYIVWWRRANRSRHEATPLPTFTLRCPSCAADTQVAPGQVVQFCAHCGASMTPSHTVMDAGLRAAEQAARTARLANLRAERQGMLELRKHTQLSLRWPAYLLGIFFGGGFTVAAIGITVEACGGERPFDSRVLFVWALPAAFFAGVFLWLRFRSWRRAVWGRGPELLVRAFNGKVLGDLDDLVDWLDRYWPVSYEPANTYWGPYGTAVALTIEGFPALVVSDPVPTDNGPPPKLHALLAAILAGFPEGAASTNNTNAPAAQEPLSALRQNGFLPTLSHAGVMIVAQEAAVSALTRPAEALAGMDKVLRDAARLARALDGQPADPASARSDRPPVC